MCVYALVAVPHMESPVATPASTGAYVSTKKKKELVLKKKKDSENAAKNV